MLQHYIGLSYSAEALQYQGVVTYMSRVEVFATKIGMSQAIKALLSVDQGMKVTSEPQKSKNQAF